MFGDIIVPLDGSDQSALAVGPAGALARFLDSKVKLVGFASPGDETEFTAWLGGQAHKLGNLDREIVVGPIGDGVAAQIGAMVAESPSALVCMSTHGRGRSASVMGSVASEVLGEVAGPVILLGPNYNEHQFRCHGNLLVSLDGSHHSEAILPVIESFAIVFGFDVTLTAVIDAKASRAAQASGASNGGAVVESVYVHRMAEEAHKQIEREVSWEVLHGDDPAKAILDHAEMLDATLIAMATHGTTGLRRMVTGSVTADVVRSARCPVLAIRPPELPA